MMRIERMRSLQKYRTIIVNGGWVLSLNAARQGLSLLLIMVLVRVLTKEEFGQYQFLVAAIAFLSITTLPGVQTAITQSVARGFDGTYRKTVRIVMLWSLLGSTGLILLGIQQWYAGHSEMLPALVVAAILFPPAHGLLHWTSYQAGKELFRRTSIYQGIGFAASYLGGIAAVLLIQPNFVLLVIVTNVVLAIQNIWVTTTIFRSIPPDAPSEDEAISYGVKTSFSSVFNITGNYIDKFLLYYLLSPETLAVYVIAERIPELLKKYMQSARSVLVPGFSRKSRFTPEMSRKLNMASFVISAGVVIIALGVIPWLIPLAFTKNYGDAVLYCQLLMGTLIIGQAATTKFTYIISRLDERSFRDITIGTNVVRIVSSAVLIPLFGVMGAIAATALYRIATALMVGFYLKKFHSSDE